MPVDVHILPKHGLVVARFHGHVRLEECLASAQGYAQHPDCRPGQNQLIDLSGMTSYERDLVQIMALMAKLPDHLLAPGAEPMVVYLAPSAVAQEVTTFVLKSMAGIGGVSVSAVADEEHALEVMGLPERRLADLLAKA